MTGRSGKSLTTPTLKVLQESVISMRMVSVSMLAVLGGVAHGAGTLKLKYHDQLDTEFNKCKRILSAELAKSCAADLTRLEKERDPSTAEVLRLGAKLTALKLIHFRKFQWKDSLRQRQWIHRQLKTRLGNCLETAIVDYYVTDFYDVVEPKEIDEKMITVSPLSAMFAFKCWSMRVKTESDLAKMKSYWAVIQKIGVHKRFLFGLEGSLYFNTFQVNKDFGALRKATDLYKAGAKLDPNPKVLESTIKWCKPWDDWLAKEGK
jgi:hypothetical protein